MSDPLRESITLGIEASLCEGTAMGLRAALQITRDDQFEQAIEALARHHDLEAQALRSRINAIQTDRSPMTPGTDPREKIADITPTDDLGLALLAVQEGAEVSVQQVAEERQWHPDKAGRLLLKLYCRCMLHQSRRGGESYVLTPRGIRERRRLLDLLGSGQVAQWPSGQVQETEQ